MTASRRSTRVLAWGAAAAVTFSGLAVAAPPAFAAPAAPGSLSPNQTTSVLKNLELTWAPVTGASSYDVEFLDDDNPDIATRYPFYTGTSPSTVVNRFAVPTNLPVGEWRWRVRANAGSQHGAWSALGRLARGWKDQVTGLRTTGGASSPLPTFSWSALPDASFYEVEFSHAPFDTSLYSRKNSFVCYTQATQLTPYGVVVDNGLGYAAPGNESSCQMATTVDDETDVTKKVDPTKVFVAGQTYHWRVRGRDGAYLGDSAGRGASTSPLFTTSAGACRGPWLDSGNNVTTTTTGVLDVNGNPILNPDGTPKTETKTVLTVPVGGTETLPTESVTGPECSGWSASGSFVPQDFATTIDPNPGIPGGLTVGPLQTGSTSVVTGDPTFSWAPVPHAVKYRLYLSNDRDLQENDYVVETMSTTFTPYSGLRLTSTPKYWAVQACTVTTASDTLPADPASRQDCGHISAVQAVKLVNPAMRAPSLAARSGYLQADWSTAVTATTHEQPEYYNLQVSDSAGHVWTHHTDRIAATTTSGTSTFAIPTAGLADGVYTARIQPALRSRRPIAWSAPSRAVVLDRVAPTVKLTSAAGFVNRTPVTLTFSEPVSNVGTSTLGVATSTGSKVAGSLTRLSSTQYRFTPSAAWLTGGYFRAWTSGVIDRAHKPATAATTLVRAGTTADSAGLALQWVSGDGSWVTRSASDAYGRSFRSTTDRSTTTKRSRASTSVYGSKVKVSYCRSPKSGYLRVYVDGHLKRVVSQYRSWSGCGSSVTVTGLSRGVHRVIVQAKANGSRTVVSVDRISVS